MEKEFYIMQMLLTIKVNFKMIYQMELVRKYSKMVLFILDHSWKDKFRDKVE